ncbi:hypothetical protein BDQ17DRAFT_1429192 [Cyathus striatus]|nr:hypothetical protein BDQ17DRAFT_1429192 [Cyathus striatus]
MSSYFNQASNFSINQAYFNETTATHIVKNGLQYLNQFVASGASHDSKDQYDAPKCAPETRTQLLGDIHNWIEVTEKETGIMCLLGPAGAGKSCIARSVCEKAASEGLLGASFFFRRGVSERNNADKLFTTIAYQLTMVDEELKKHILAEVDRNPRISDMPLEIQFRSLVLEPCLKISRDQLRIQAIVIDRLDECVDAINLETTSEGKELNIKEIIFATQAISLARIPGVSQDIGTVLQSGFIRILNDRKFRRAFKSVPRPWPHPDSIEKIVQRSSDQFIYSATVLKFISSPDHNPVSQLEIVLGIRDSGDSNPFTDLDLLYHEVLSRVEYPDRTIKVLGYILSVKDIATTGVLSEYPGEVEHYYRSVSNKITYSTFQNQNRLLIVVEQLLELSQGEAYLALNQLHSLISLNVGSDSTRRHLEIEFYHKSFQDFLTSKSRSNTFYVDIKAAHLHVANFCLKFLGRPNYDTEEQHGPFYCTSDDYAKVYSVVVSTGRWYNAIYPDSFVDVWIPNLPDLNSNPASPAATDALLKSLKSAAQKFHDNDAFNQRLWRDPEENLLIWLQNLLDPPRDVIEAWKRAYKKARRTRDDY